MNLDEIVTIIPELFLFIIPGYIAIRIYEKYGLEKKMENFDMVLYSILYSFLVGIIYSLICSIALVISTAAGLWIQGDIAKQIISLLLSVILGLIIVKFQKAKIGEYLGKVFNKKLSNYPNVWIKAMENEEGAWATVFMKNGFIYTGKLIYYTADQNDNTREILLTNYRLGIQSKDHMDVPNKFCCVITDYTADCKSKVLLDRNDILSIEINSGQSNHSQDNEENA